MQIAVSVDNNKDVRILPVTPRDVQIGYPLLTEEIDSIKYGQLLVLKNEGLATVDISSFFPTKKYPFMQPGSSRRVGLCPLVQGQPEETQAFPSGDNKQKRQDILQQAYEL